MALSLPANVRFQVALSQPLIRRCQEIAALIEEGSIKDLQSIFPALVESIFGFSNAQGGWGLKCISRLMQPRDFDALRNFLSPDGPMIRLVYRLMSDGFLRYDFPLSCLPASTRRVLEEGGIPLLYVNKIQLSTPGRLPTALCLNAFEYYLFHMAYYLVSPHTQKSSNNWTMPIEALYSCMVDDYLQYFLPADGGRVPSADIPLTARSPLSPSQVLNRMNPFSGPTDMSGRSSMSPSYSPSPLPPQSLRLFKSKSPNQTAAPPPLHLPEQMQMETWRSETAAQIFIEVWLTTNTTESTSPMMSPIQQEPFYPNYDHIRVVRMLVKHLHYFTNSYAVGSINPLQELKRTVIPLLLQKKLYSFLQYTIAHWPLDASFRLVLETWLSYIQPWRYTDIRSQRHNVWEKGPEERDNTVEWIWQKFISENLAFYTVIFQQMLPRFFRVDLSTPKNAYMLYRVTKVYSQPNLCTMIAEAEHSLQDSANHSTSQFLNSSSGFSRGSAAIVRQHLMELECPGFQYVPLCGEDVRLQVRNLVEVVVRARLSAQLLMKSTDNSSAGFWASCMKSLASLFDTGSYYSTGEDFSPSDSRKLDMHLEMAAHQLCVLFKVELPVFQEVSEGLNDSLGSFSMRGHRSMAPPSGRHSPDEQQPQPDGFGSGPIPVHKRNLVFRGNPDIQPIRSFEVVCLVRWLHQLATHFNDKYCARLSLLYQRRDFFGYFCKQFMTPPIDIYETDKLTCPPTMRQHRLPPRLSLRFMAHKQFIGYLLALLLVGYIWGYHPLLSLVIMCGLVIVCAGLRASFDVLRHLNRTRRSR